MATPSGITTSTQVIDGHTYLMTYDATGRVLMQIGADPSLPPPPPPPIQAKGHLLISALINGSATPQQRDTALAAVLALQMGLVDVTSSS